MSGWIVIGIFFAIIVATSLAADAYDKRRDHR